jgi:hypothetical protein
MPQSLSQRLTNPGFIVLVPAYGRTYNTTEEVKEDWYNGLDFRIINGPYCSIRDKALIKKDFGAAYIRFGLNREKTIQVI